MQKACNIIYSYIRVYSKETVEIGNKFIFCLPRIYVFSMPSSMAGFSNIYKTHIKVLRLQCLSIYIMHLPNAAAQRRSLTNICKPYKAQKHIFKLLFNRSCARFAVAHSCRWLQQAHAHMHGQLNKKRAAICARGAFKTSLKSTV